MCLDGEEVASAGALSGYDARDWYRSQSRGRGSVPPNALRALVLKRVKCTAQWVLSKEMGLAPWIGKLLISRLRSGWVRSVAGQWAYAGGRKARISEELGTGEEDLFVGNSQRLGA